jgi:hypothetical protein
MCRIKIKVPSRHLSMLRFYGKQLEKHLINQSLDLLSDEIRQDILSLLQTLSFESDTESLVTSSSI